MKEENGLVMGFGLIGSHLDAVSGIEEFCVGFLAMRYAAVEDQKTKVAMISW